MTNSTTTADTGTWEIWGSADPADDPMPADNGLTHSEAIARVDELHAQGHTTVYAQDSVSDETYPTAVLGSPLPRHGE